MPKNTAATVTDLDYDLASLSEPLTADGLEMLSTVLDARDLLHELLAYTQQVQALLEAGRTPFEVRELFGLDLDDLTDKFDAAKAWMLNA